MLTISLQIYFFCQREKMTTNIRNRNDFCAKLWILYIAVFQLKLRCWHKKIPFFDISSPNRIRRPLLFGW